MVSSLLTWTVMLSLLPVVQTCTTEMLHNTESCQKGYYKEGTTCTCKKCKKCEEISYLIVAKECDHSSDTICACRQGYYDAEYARDTMFCVKCVPVKTKRCACHRNECLGDSECLHCRNSATSATTIATLKNKITTSRKSDNRVTLTIVLVVVAAVILLLCLWFPTCCNVHSDRGPPCAGNDSADMNPSLNGREPLQCRSNDSLMVMMQRETATPESHDTPLLTSSAHPAPIRILIPPERPTERWPAAALYAIIREVPLRRWKEFLRHLAVGDEQMERVDLEAGLGSLEKQYQMLRLWSQRASADTRGLYSALRSMELTSCAQALQEILEKLGTEESQ